jgi:alpha-L-fucosidase
VAFAYGKMAGGTWNAQQLINMVRSLQTHLIIDNRLEGSGEKAGTILSANPSDYAGDFACPKQMLPPKGIINELGESVLWEACLTLNTNWGLLRRRPALEARRHDDSYACGVRFKKRQLAFECGSDAKGRIPEASVRILEEVSVWIKKSASIYGCGISDSLLPDKTDAVVELTLKSKYRN